MTAFYRVTARGVPLVRQHDPDPDGQPSPGRDDNCGEGCVVALVRWAFGLTALSVEDVRRDLLGDKTGPTTPEQLSVYLANECNIPNTIILPTTQASYLWQEYHYLVAGRPLIALRFWEKVGASTLHYCLDVEQTEQSSTVMDPEIGSLVVEDYALHWRMAQGHSTLIGIDRDSAV